MPAPLLVAFAGPGEGIESLSWGQAAMWDTIQREGQSVTMGGISPLPEGTPLCLLAQLLGFALSRHPALRTRLVFEPDGTVRQRLFASGEIALDVVEAGTEDPYQVAERVRDGYCRRDFDYEQEWPVRMAAICQAGQPRYTVAVYLHLQLDAGGLQALIDDLARMDPETGSALAPAEGISPFEQARQQRLPVARRQSEASLKHLARALRSVPAQRFGPPISDGPACFPLLTYTSPALRLATEFLSRHCGLDTSPILLGLMATAVGQRYHTSPFLAVVAVSNRFRPGFERSVSKVAGVSPCVVDAAEISLVEVFHRARRASLAAYKHAYYDPVARQRLLEEIAAERGEPVDTSCFFSDRRPDRPAPGEPASPEQVSTAMSQARWQIEVEGEMVPEKLYLSIDAEDRAIVVRMTFDRRYFTDRDAVELVRAMERLALAAVRDPHAPSGVRSPALVAS